MARKVHYHTLKDGSGVWIRALNGEDCDRCYRFFNELPEEDRLYLRFDMTDPEIVRMRLQRYEAEKIFHIGAFADEGMERLVGEGSLEWPSFGWLSHVGSLRAITARTHRRKGLATVLFRDLFIQAVKEGLEKAEARMPREQQDAVGCLEKLGFTEEGILPGFVLDLHGVPHDLLIMSVNLEGF